MLFHTQTCRRRRGRWWCRSAARTTWTCPGNVPTLTEAHRSSSTSSRSVTSLVLLKQVPCGWCVVQWRQVSCRCVSANCCKATHICSECPPRTASVPDHPPSYKNLSLHDCLTVCCVFVVTSLPQSNLTVAVGRVFSSILADRFNDSVACCKSIYCQDITLVVDAARHG